MGAGASEPSPRYGHYSAAVEGKLYIWGGGTKNFRRDKNALTSTLHVFDPFMEAWETKRTTGDHPPGIYRGVSASIEHHIYQYGGTDGSSHHGSLHHLDTTTLHWTELPSGPAKKSDCGMIICGNRLVLFGGWNGIVRTNMLHAFDRKTGE